jgi:hypothetical protein
MILEFVGDYPSQVWSGGFLALHSGTASELRALALAVAVLCRSERQRLPIHDLPYVSPVLGCQLHGASVRSDQGVYARRGPRAFTLVLSQESWESARSLILRFASDQNDTPVGQLNPTDFGPPVVYCASAPQ